MTTQEALEPAFQKIVENARANCHQCQIEDEWRNKGRWHDYFGNLRSAQPPENDHTCHATIAAAAEFGDELLDSINCICDGQDDKNAARVTIKRLLEEAKK
jgi:hypothetical protein